MDEERLIAGEKGTGEGSSDAIFIVLWIEHRPMYLLSSASAREGAQGRAGSGVMRAAAGKHWKVRLL